mgnify:CR=1 FL=1
MEIIHLGPWQLGVLDYSLSNPQQRVELEPLLFKLLHYFAIHPRRIINRQELVEAIWQQNYVDDNAINRAISELRKVLQHPDLPVSPIKTHHRKGYSLQLDPQYSQQQANALHAQELAAQQHRQPLQTTDNVLTKNHKPNKAFVPYLSALLLLLLSISGYILLKHSVRPAGTESAITEVAAVPVQQNRQQLDVLNRQKVTWFKGVESRPLLSPDKSYLAYSHTLPDGHIRVVVRKQNNAVASAPQEMIIEAPDYLIFAHTWQPKSQILLVQKFRKDGSACTFERYNFSTFPAGPAEAISQCQHLNISPAQLSEDGQILFRAQSSNGLLTPSALVAENLNTGHIQLIADAPPSGFGAAMLALSPDGKRLAYIMMPESNQPEIYVYSLEQRELQRLAALPIPMVIMGLEWSAAGDYLLMPVSNALLKLDVNTKILTTLLLPSDLQVGEISLLSENQAYVSPLSFGSAVQGGIQILRISDPFNPEQTQVSPFSDAAGSTHELIFHPSDPKQLAFTANWNGNWQLWLSDGKQHYAVTEFTGSEVMIGSLDWSPNGRYIALTRQGNLFLYDLQLKQLLQKTQDNDIAQILWLADNSGLVVTRIKQNSQNLWQLDLLSGELQQLTYIAASQPQYDDKGQLHYVRDGELYRYIDGRRADLPRPELNPGPLYQQNQLWGDSILSISFMGHLRKQTLGSSDTSPATEAQFPYQFMSLYPNPHNSNEVFVSVFQPSEMALEYIEWQAITSNAGGLNRQD